MEQVPTPTNPPSGLKIVALTRVFEDNGVILADPAPGMALDNAIRILAMTGRPHLASAEIRGPEMRGDQAVYVLHRQVGTKGATPVMTTRAGQKAASRSMSARKNLAGYKTSFKPHQPVAEACLPLLGTIAGNRGSRPLAMPSDDLPWVF